MFRGLDQKNMAVLMSRMVPVHFSEGDVLTHQNDMTTHLFVITEGDVQRRRLQEETGRLHHMETLGSHASRNTVGALHLLQELPCYATTECLTDGVAYTLDCKQLKKVMNENPTMGIEIVNALTEEIFNMSQRNRTPLLQQEGRPTNFLTISAAAAIESYYRSGVNAWLNSVLTKRPIDNLFPNMHIQLPVRVLYINGLKGVREALQPYYNKNSSETARVGLAVLPGVAMTPLSSILEASNAGHMNPEPMTTRWLRGIVPRCGREVVFGIGLNQLSDYMEERVASTLPTVPKTLHNALGSVFSGLLAGYFSHIPHNLSTLKLMQPQKSYLEHMGALMKDGEKRASSIFASPTMQRIATPLLTFVFPAGLMVRSIQIAGSFVIINSLNYQFAQSVAQHPSNISRRPSIISRLSER